MKQILAILAVLTLFSCNQSQQEKVKLTIIGENTANIQAMMSLEKDYEKKNPNVDLVFKPNTWEDAFNKSNQDFANGTGLYDIVMQYNFALSPFVKNGYVHTLDTLRSMVEESDLSFESDLYQNAWKELGYYYGPSADLIRVGYPFAINTMLLIYNKEMFEDSANQKRYEEKYGANLEVPTTWEALRNVADFFTDSEKGTHGICMQGDGSTGTWLYYEYVNYLFGMGGKVMNKDFGWQGDANTKIELDSPESLDALKFYLSLKPFNAGNYTNVEQFEQIQQMKTGKVAMSVIWSDVVYSTLKDENGFDNRFGYAPIPGDKSFFAGGAFFVNKDTKHPKEVAEYVVYLMQPETQVELAKLGLASPLKSTYTNAEVQELPYTAALKQSLDRGCYMLEAGPDADLIAQKITTYVQKCWLGELTPEEATSKMQEEISSERPALFN